MLKKGGTGADLSAIAKGGLISGTGAAAVGITTVGTDGQVLSADSASAGGIKWITVSGTGTVTTVSVVSANGFAGTVANATTTPAITLTTTITGVLKGNGTAISAATDGTDYLSPTTGITVSQSSGQTLGTTTNRLTKLWATDITVTNAIAGSITGNAATATALQNARTIGGVSFDGTANITVASATGGFTVSGGNLTTSAINIVTDTTTGTKISTATTQKLGFFKAVLS